MQIGEPKRSHIHYNDWSLNSLGEQLLPYVALACVVVAVSQIAQWSVLWYTIKLCIWQEEQAKPRKVSMNTLYDPPPWVFLATLLGPSSFSFSLLPYNPKVDFCAVLSTILVPSEPHLEQHIRICEQPFFKWDDNELGAFELGAEELTYVLGMREI